MSDFKGIKLEEDEKEAAIDCGKILGKLLLLKNPTE